VTRCDMPVTGFRKKVDRGIASALFITLSTLFLLCYCDDASETNENKRSREQSTTEGEPDGIDGRVEIPPEQRLQDYREYAVYPIHNRPADEDTPDLKNWPGYNGPVVKDAKISAISGEALRAGSLYIKFIVQVVRQGCFTFDTLLIKASSRNKIATSSLTRKLAEGSHELELHFFGKIMRDRKIAGPYEIPGIIGQLTPCDEDIYIAESDKDLSTEKEGDLEPLFVAYTTESYSLNMFTDKPFESLEKKAKIKSIQEEIQRKNQ